MIPISTFLLDSEFGFLHALILLMDATYTTILIRILQYDSQYNSVVEFKLGQQTGVKFTFRMLRIN